MQLVNIPAGTNFGTGTLPSYTGLLDVSPTKVAVPSAKMIPVTPSANKVVQTTAPVAQTQTNTQSSGNSSSGRDPHINPSTGQWDDNYYQSQQSVSAPSIDWNAIYDPIFQNYDQQEALLRDQDLPNQQAQINNQATDLLSQVNQQKSDQLQDIANQNTALSYQKQSAYDDAVRARNALSQQAQSRFGRGTSAYGGVSDIADQEYYRSSGNVSNTYAQNFTKLQQYQSQVLKRADDETLRIDRDKNQQLNDLNVKFNQALQQINGLRAQSESQKASQKAQALQDAINQTNQIKANFAAQQEALKVWLTQQQYLINQGVTQLQSQRYTTPSNTFAGDNTLNGYSVGPNGQTGNSNTLSGAGGLNILGNNQNQDDNFLNSLL